MAGSDTIQQVKERADIVQIIGERVHLAPSGANFKGLCPFHGEKTPSFMVNPQRQMFHCFGCGKGGSVIDFVMEYERLTFAEALAELAHKVGVSLERKPGQDKQDRQLEVLRAAQDYYHRLLLDSPQGEPARRYLRERHFDQDAWRMFNLGYALDDWQGFTHQGQSLGFATEDMLGSGLVKQGESGRLFDMMRKRVIFPIQDGRQNPIAFGGRVMDPLDTPKYLNTPETTHYHKSRVLYGWPQARPVFRQAGQAILVEGYLDVIRLHLHGFKEAVATCGTALTPEHLQQLERHADRVVLLFDGDAAGVKAALRSAPLFLNRGIEALVVTLPEQLDPDEYLQARGRDAFAQELARGTPILEYLVFQTLQRHGQSPQGKERAINDLLPLLSAIQKESTRDLTLRHLADLAGLRAQTLQQMLIPTPQEGESSQDPRGARGARGPAQGAPAADVSPSPLALPKEYRHQRLFIAMLLEQRQLLPLARMLLVPTELSDPDLQALYSRMLGLAPQEFAQITPEEMTELFPEVASPLRSLLMEPSHKMHVILDFETQLRHTAANIKALHIDTLLRRLKAVAGTPAEEETLRELQQVRKTLANLKK